MSGDARTLPLRDAPAVRGRVGRGGALLARAGAITRAERETWLGAVALGLIVVGSAFIVLAATNRPSVLAPTTHANYFPRWMAGPLGGLWPSLTRNSTTLKYLFSGALVAMYAGYVLALYYARQLRARWVIGAIVAVHALFLLSVPLALTDIFNYVNYGRMEVVHHLNPYTTIPILEPHGDPSYDLSNWHQLLSPYGPLFTLLTFAFVPLGVAASFWALKGLLALASLGTLYLIWRCAELLGRDPLAAIVLVGLNPVVLVWGLGGDHNDFLMLFFIVLALLLLLLSARARQDAARTAPRAAGAVHLPPAQGGREASVAREARSALGTAIRRRLAELDSREIGAGAALVTAAAIKASGAVVIPVVLASLIKAPRRLLGVALGMALAGVVAGCASLAAFGLHVPDLTTQSRLVTNLSIPNIVGLMVGAGGETSTLHVLFSAALGAALVACCLSAWRRGEAIAACGWASVALLATLSWALPWYVLWVLPLAALSASRRLRIASLVLGVYLIIAWAPASGQLWNAIGLHPEKTPLGRLHQRSVKELLN
ncbi:MAG: hypothetical protein E6G34_00865 [Actinobacteria bacterium]|nr:MAG: hypothetical protein E6G34_00865 [Actinomycetota bacterium]